LSKEPFTTEFRLLKKYGAKLFVVHVMHNPFGYEGWNLPIVSFQHEPKARLEQDVKEARLVLDRLPVLGISIDNVSRQLEDEGVEKFNKPFDKLMATLAQRSPRI
jgi:hypothetical protein